MALETLANSVQLRVFVVINWEEILLWEGIWRGGGGNGICKFVRKLRADCRQWGRLAWITFIMGMMTSREAKV